jgi:long-chain acyl-CoA synthetase
LLFLPGGERYAELNARTDRLANWMRFLGVEKGDGLSILVPNGVEYVDVSYGLAKIGAILAPLNWRLVARGLVYIVNDCQPKMSLCGPEFAEVLADMRPEMEVTHYVCWSPSSLRVGWTMTLG